METKAHYAVLFTTVLAIALFARYDGPYISMIASYLSISEIQDQEPDVETTERELELAFRMLMVLLFFFGGMSALTATVSTAHSHAVHHDYFKWKWFIVFMLSMIAFHMPDALVDIYTVTVRVVAAMYLVIQLLIMVDFLYKWNVNWREKSMYNRWYGVAGVASTVLAYAIGIALAIYAYHSFAMYGTCMYNIVILISTVLLGAIYSVISVSVHGGHGSLLQSSFIFMYLTWTSLLSRPESSCNPFTGDSGWSHAQLIIGILMVVMVIVRCTYVIASRSTLIRTPSGHDITIDQEFPGMKDETVNLNVLPRGNVIVNVGLAVEDWIVKMLLTKKILLDKQPEPEPVETGVSEHDQLTTKRQSTARQMSYSFFHLLFTLGAAYISMCMTSWGDDVSSVNDGALSMWVQYAVAIVTGVLYMYVMIAPVVRA